MSEEREGIKEGGEKEEFSLFSPPFEWSLSFPNRFTVSKFKQQALTPADPMTSRFLTFSATSQFAARWCRTAGGSNYKTAASQNNNLSTKPPAFTSRAFI